VVVADDSPAHLELLTVVLGALPQLDVVATATDGREAVQVALAHEADVALLDVEMPILDGFDSAQEIRRLRPQTNVILHTSLLNDDSRRRGEEFGLSVFSKFELVGIIELVACDRPGRALRHCG
jgi:CheY-like chemotaxis protein